MTDAALLIAIRAGLAASPFHGKGHRKVWARLRYRGTRPSLRRVLRLRRENALLAPTRAGAPRGPRAHDGTIVPDAVDTMWGTDLTTAYTGEGPAAVFIAVDHASAECVGIHAHASATRFEALEPIRQGCDGTSAASPRASHVASRCATITARNTCPTPSRRSSPSLASRARPPFRAPEGNGCAERFVRTLEENLLWVQSFETIEDLRQALLAFRETYNATWLIERHGFISPAECRQKQLQPLAEAA